MARPLRPIFAGAYYHVTTRGNCGMFIYSDAEDRVVFLHLLARVARRYRWRIHGYCLMGNHYHLVVETREANLDLGMRDLNGDYARGFNGRHERRDHLFGRRYWAEPISDDAQLEDTLL